MEMCLINGIIVSFFFKKKIIYVKDSPLSLTIEILYNMYSLLYFLFCLFIINDK